jgi:tetratricopeptide (TPR) repeat protein
VEIDQLAEVRDAVEHGRWARAEELLEAAGAAASTSEGLELSAQAAYGAGRFEACVSAWEALHARFVDEGDQAGAARAAAMLAMYLMMDTGLMAPVRGWLRRAERLLDDHAEVPAHALVAMVRTYERFMCGDMAAAREQSEQAIELGERLGVPPAVVIGRVARARVTILDGDLDDGLAQLDEVGALLMSGEVDPLTTGMMYCELICAAQGLAMHDRASEWTEVMERWRHGRAFGGIHGRCRVHRAEMLRMTGPSGAAEMEALGACDELRPWMRREFGWPLAELGNIRLRRGDLDGAEEAFLAAHAHGWCPHPGLAQLRLAQGEVSSAAALIADAIAHPVRCPSKERPPYGNLYLAPLLDAQVEIAAAAGDRDTAQTATARLEAIADEYQASPQLAASAALARARTSLLEGNPDGAVASCAEAISVWSELGAPFETAAARTVLAEAHERAGNHEAAGLERRATDTALAAYGTHRVTGTDREREPGPGRTAAEANAMFKLDGDLRVVRFAGAEAVVRDLKGFRYLERMLADPHREFHVLDLVAVEAGTLPTHEVVDLELVVTQGDGGLPVIDAQAREAYRHRLREVEEDIEDAERADDLGRLELAERDREFLVAELSRAVGLGGRLRSTGSDAERARGSVTRCLRYALEQLSCEIPPLAAHLRTSLGTGTYCAYRPDPLASVEWET